MNKIELTKTVVNFVVGAGTSKIVHSIIKENVTTENAYESVSVAAASLVIGSMAADASKKYTSAKIDDAVNWWKTNVTTKTEK